MTEQPVNKHLFCLETRNTLTHLLFSGTLPQLHISYKPQKISPRSHGLVRQLLHEKIRDAYIHPQVNITFLAFVY